MSEPDQETSIVWDDWPIERSDPPDVTEEGGTGAATADDYVAEGDYEWIGLSTQTGDAYVVEPSQHTLYQGRVDEENERIVVREESRRELESEESLGERIEEIGDEQGWEWLSSFARTYLEDGDERDAGDEREELIVRFTEFQERNVTDEEDHDLAYTGTHTLEDRSGHVHVLERRFDVSEEGDHVTVSLREDFLVAEEPLEEDRAGDADRVAKREDEFDVDVDESSENRDAKLRDALQEWHESTVEWPDAAR